MNTTSSPSPIYQKNYENHLERILESAEKLFIRDGIESVSMNAIADEARIARKTLYKYFPNKQEIAFGIFKRFMERITEASDFMNIPGDNGFERLKYFLMSLPDTLEKYAEDFRFMLEFDAIYARGGDPARVRQMYSAGYDILLPIIHQGISDGSIRPDLDPDFLAATTFNLISGMNGRFAMLGSQIGEEYGRPVKELYQGILRIYLQGIRCPGIDDQHVK